MGYNKFFIVLMFLCSKYISICVLPLRTSKYLRGPAQETTNVFYNGNLSDRGVAECRNQQEYLTVFASFVFLRRGCGPPREHRVLLQDRAGNDSWHRLCRCAADPCHCRCHLQMCWISASEDRKSR